MNELDWQPIDTVPRDGTDILIGWWYEEESDDYWAESGWEWIVQGRYIDDDHFWLAITGMRIPVTDMTKPPMRPTHWSALPVKPTERGRGEATTSLYSETKTRTD